MLERKSAEMVKGKKKNRRFSYSCESIHLNVVLRTVQRIKGYLGIQVFNRKLES